VRLDLLFYFFLLNIDSLNKEREEGIMPFSLFIIFKNVKLRIAIFFKIDIIRNIYRKFWRIEL